MASDFVLPIGPKVILTGHFDVPAILEHARMLGAGYECRFRLPDGSLEEAASLAKSFQPPAASVQSVHPKKIRLLMEGGHVSGWLILMTVSSPVAFREFKRIPVKLGLFRDRGL